MKITGYENENLILKELGERIKKYRISMNMTQSELVKKSGVSLSTLVRIENGEDTKLSNLIKIMLVLNISENIDMLIPEEKSDYKAIFEEKKSRKRVRKKNIGKNSDWVWGEDKQENKI